MALFLLRNSGRILSLVPVFLGIVQSGSTQEKAEPKEAPRAIRLSPEQIPAVPGSLPVFGLSAQKPPLEFVREALRPADPEVKKLAPVSEIPQLFAKGEKLASFCKMSGKVSPSSSPVTSNRYARPINADNDDSFDRCNSRTIIGAIVSEVRTQSGTVGIIPVQLRRN
jgi:hypothetical protein